MLSSLFKRVFSWAAKTIKCFNRGHTVDIIFLVNVMPRRVKVNGDGTIGNGER